MHAAKYFERISLRIVPNFGIPRSCVIAKFNETYTGINTITEIVTGRHPDVPLNSDREQRLIYARVYEHNRTPVLIVPGVSVCFNNKKSIMQTYSYIRLLPSNSHDMPLKYDKNNVV